VAKPTSMPMCPMAEICKGMMEKPLSGFVLIVPALVLIALGVVVVVEPRILVWLVAVALVVMGIAMLVLAKLMHKVAERFGSIRG